MRTFKKGVVIAVKSNTIVQKHRYAELTILTHILLFVCLFVLGFNATLTAKVIS